MAKNGIGNYPPMGIKCLRSQQKMGLGTIHQWVSITKGHINPNFLIFMLWHISKKIMVKFLFKNSINGLMI